MPSSETNVRELLPLRDRIEIRAYELYLLRGCEDGHADEDWLAAEAELTAPQSSREQLRPEARRAAATR